MIDVRLVGGPCQGTWLSLASPYTPTLLSLAPLRGEWIVIGTDKIPLPDIPFEGTVTYKLVRSASDLQPHPLYEGSEVGLATYVLDMGEFL